MISFFLILGATLYFLGTRIVRRKYNSWNVYFGEPQSRAYYVGRMVQVIGFSIGVGSALTLAARYLP